ncbi:hypothetical protein ETAA8_66880 [Anatilimnocola aggregata]|uniref:Alpha glucuronidase N-terminal domain-containing protein n=1 Tax=Anatilimnocola aggregata TaxID=2528021 RepID=A0A517YMS4_9BACT|nr:hypothetical protein [Anatilimnocola aggregata]QDU31529.1 hypothetical protein ETAA8_66880 [Anatilimnocola aggregata]
MRTFRHLLLIGLALCFASFAAAEQKIEVIVGELAPPLEQQAAEEVAAGLRRIYQADVSVLPKPTGKLPVIFVGSPATNKSLEFFVKSWPKLNAQGHLVKSTTFREQPALVIGGDNPRTTYWAAAEYLHALGVRSLLYGDLDPIAPPEFSLAGFDLKLEPPQSSCRGWQLGGNSPFSSLSWGKSDLQQLIGQLAKLKFNKIIFDVHPNQPFVSVDVDGVHQTKAQLWDAPPLSVSGDTAGRAAFKGAKTFENPDFTGKEKYEDQLAAGKALLQTVIETAHLYGMTVGLRSDRAPAPAEFAQAYQTAYPQLDQIYQGIDNRFFPRMRGPNIQQSEQEALRDLGGSIRQLTDDANKITVVASDKGATFLRLNGDPGGILPQFSPASLAGALQNLPHLRTVGFIAESPAVGDLDFAAYFLSRQASNENLTLAEACEQLLTPVCGEEVHTRVTTAMQLVELAALSIDLNDPQFAIVEPQMMLKQYQSAEPAPAWWGKVRESYLNAMNEMYRANTRAREGSRSYTLHLARRYEFGFEYMNCVQAVRAAGLAKKKGDKEMQIAELEKAIDSINGACNALAAVARNNSDRGTIAVLNAYVYRPLVKELEAADAE